MTGTLEGLSGQASKGVRVTLIGQVVRVVTLILSAIVLARLLPPSAFGLVAMVVAVIGIGEVLRDLGLSTAAIQARELSRAQRDNLFWVNSAIGMVLAAFAAALAWPLAWVYTEPALVGITLALSTTFLLNGLGTQHKASINRSMRFGALTAVEVIPPAIGLAAAVIAAIAGLGYWALVMQQILQAALALAFSWGLSRWVPRWYDRSAAIGAFLRFGGNLAAVQILTYLSRNVASILIGLRFESAALGLYDRAFQLVMMPLNQLNAPATRVALPVLSQLQDDPDTFSRYIERGQTILLRPLTTVFIALIALADPLVLAVLGEAWSGASIFVRILAVGAIAQAASYSAYWVFLSRGLTGSNLRFALATRPIVIVALIFGSLFSPFGVALAYSASLLVIWPIGYWWLRRVPGVYPGRLIVTGAQSILTGAPAGLVSFGVVSLVALLGYGEWMQLLMGLVAYVVAVLATALVMRPVRNEWKLVTHQLFRRARKK